MFSKRHTLFPRARRVTLLVAVVFLVLGAGVTAPRAEEGYDLMRQITTQWVNPFITIVFDTSGSMQWTIDETDQKWNFDYGNIDGYIYSQNDWTDGQDGIGQGFWMRVYRDESGSLAMPPTEFVYDGYRWDTGWVDHDFDYLIYTDQAEDPFTRGDLVRIVGYPIDGVDGIYMVATNSSQSVGNSGAGGSEWYYTQFYRMNEDGTFSDTAYHFPLDDDDVVDCPQGAASDVCPFTLELVYIESNPSQFDLDYDWQATGFNRGNCYLHGKNTSQFDAGDLVYVYFSNNDNRNGWHLVRHVDSGNDRMYLSAMNNQSSFPNEDVCFSGQSDNYVYVSHGSFPQNPLTIWYFVPASRMAIAKNAWGDSVTLHNAGIPPDGYDSRDKPYYIFQGEGPVDGAWYEYGHGWHNWASWEGHEPVGDPQYTLTDEPADMITRFGEVANLGLVEYSGGTSYCDDGQPVTVDIETDDDAQGPILSTLHEEFDVVGAGGVSASGGTPTRAGLKGAGNALEEAYRDDPKAICGRTYGVILLTDGRSNNCNNPSNGTWWDPFVDGCSSGSDTCCPNSWEDYPADISNDLWNLTVDGYDLNVRTWSIGVSNGIGPCELNYTAYKGRTDASSPFGDSGYNIDADPWIAEDDSDVWDEAQEMMGGHGNYAYFANSVDELRQALAEILASLGAGDYTTSAPAVAGSAQVGANMAFLASSKYPGWKGHLRGFRQEYDNQGNLQWVEAWDAGEELGASDDEHPNNDEPRALYTWDPSNGNALVEIASANVDTLDGLCGSCGIDADVVSFIRGEAVNGNERQWRLGALMNSTPAVIGPPEKWNKSIEGRESFEQDYAGRHTMVWVGGSDGMIHAFDPVDGTEIIALLPPDLLDEQIDLYDQWSVNPAKYPTGQPTHPDDHIYGVANSVRFADIWDDTGSQFRTVIFVPEGPGGSGVHAIDVTHPYPGRTVGGDSFVSDPNYDSDAPVTVLWSVTANTADPDFTGLGDETWSLPAVAVDDIDNQDEASSVVILGRGYRDNDLNAVNPNAWLVDALTGDIVEPHALDNTSSGYWVNNQAFADSVIWQTDAAYYKPDNVVDEALQADLNGVLWGFSGNGWKTAERVFETNNNGPIYYSPAVAGYPTSTPGYDLYAFSTGSFYESSEEITGSNTSFVPKLVLGTRNLSSDDMDKVEISITDVPLPVGDDGTSPGTLGDRAQVIAPPLLLVPAGGSTQDPFALYLVYDPDGDVCVGVSYIVWVNFTPGNLSAVFNNPGDWIESYEAGRGAAGGFALAGESVIVSQSAVGEDAEAELVEVPNLHIPPGNPGRTVSGGIAHQLSTPAGGGGFAPPAASSSRRPVVVPTHPS